MNTTREILDLAAKAGGIQILWCDGEPRLVDGKTPWNPENDYGDALRLASTLCLTVEFRPLCVCVWQGKKQYPSYAKQDCDVKHACMAITRAAAEIGRAMP